MSILFEQISGKTEHYYSLPATFDTDIKASHNSKPLGTGVLITVEAADAHVIQFVDRGIFTYQSDYSRVYSTAFSGVRYGLSGDSAKGTKKLTQKKSRQRYVDIPSDSKSPCADMDPRIPCVKTKDKLEFFDAPGNTFSVTGGQAEQGEVGEFVAVTFCLSGNQVVKIIKWNLFWIAGRKAPSCDVRFKEPNQQDILKYRGFLEADPRWTGKSTQYVASSNTPTAQTQRVDSVF